MNEAIAHPELIVGIAGPIGVDIDAITLSLQTSLRDVGYNSKVIKLTKAMMAYPASTPKVDEENFARLMNYKMDYADELCVKHNDLAFLARVAVTAIREVRRDITKDDHALSSSTAYIIRQFKRPEEINLMRSVYGKHFVLVSAYGSQDDRKKILEERMRRSTSTLLPDSSYANEADLLIERDASEEHKFGGQQLRDTFHLADVFIDGIAKQAMDLKLTRFMRSFFG